MSCRRLHNRLVVGAGGNEWILAGGWVVGGRRNYLYYDGHYGDKPSRRRHLTADPVRGRGGGTAVILHLFPLLTPALRYCARRGGGGEGGGGGGEG